MTRPSVCLSMIVKDEAHVVARCLASVRPLIDAYVIHDTGSTDGTGAAIRAALDGLPGALRRVPWVDFAQNRNRALVEARRHADYVLFMDADDWLEMPGAPPRLGAADLYEAEFRDGGFLYSRTLIVASALPARYVGAMHEVLHTPPCRAARLPGLAVRATREGARNRDPAKYRRDAAVLEAMLAADPGDTRSLFYLAQSWRHAGETDIALARYRQRAALDGGWADERWYSLYQIGRLLERKGAPWPEVAQAYLRAWEFMPSRAEPLYRVGTHHVAAHEWAAARTVLGRAAAIPKPDASRLFVEPSLYDVSIPFELSLACAHSRDFAGAAAAAERVLANPDLDPELRAQVEHIRDHNRARATHAAR